VWLALWGLDKNGVFVGEQSKPSFWSTFLRIDDSGVVERIQQDIKTCVIETEKELARIATCHLSEREQNKRVLFHFQKDLMAGLNEQILETQDHRESIIGLARSSSAKLVCSLFLGVEHLGMVFYVFLFGLTKDSPHQQAWAQSFVMWLVMEIVLFSSMMVLVNNILLPLLTMKELGAVRLKVVQAISEYDRRLRRHGKDDSAMDPEGKAEFQPGDSAWSFNAAKYFFVSHRLARACPELAAAKMVLQYVTPWPRQSYLHAAQAMTSKYSKKYSAIVTAIQQIALFFLFSFLSSPTQIQDMCIQILSTVMFAYVAVLHLQLLAIYPVLVVVPSLLVIAVVYVLIQQKRHTPSMTIKHDTDASAPLHHKLQPHQPSPQRPEPLPIPLQLLPTQRRPPQHLTRRQSLQAGVDRLGDVLLMNDVDDSLSSQWSSDFNTTDEVESYLLFSESESLGLVSLENSLECSNEPFCD
jgi:hypothetical protein